MCCEGMEHDRQTHTWTIGRENRKFKYLTLFCDSLGFIYSEVYFGINVAIDDVLSKLKYFRHIYTLWPIHPTICMQVNTDTESMNLIVCIY